MAEIIFALDFDDLGEASGWVKNLKKDLKFFKIGFQLFLRYGPKAVEMVRREDREVFLDLKIFDIPRTCREAVRAASAMGCYSLTVHPSAGEEALREAAQARTSGRPHLWGVTVLSSSPDGSSSPPAELSRRLGLDGLIVSGRDVAKIRKLFPSMEITSPGIRPAGYAGADDQKRVLTPLEAAEAGADFLVMGRPIKNAEDPARLVREIKEEIGCVKR